MLARRQKKGGRERFCQKKGGYVDGHWIDSKQAMVKKNVEFNSSTDSLKKGKKKKPVSFALFFLSFWI